MIRFIQSKSGKHLFNVLYVREAGYDERFGEYYIVLNNGMMYDISKETYEKLRDAG